MCRTVLFILSRVYNVEMQRKPHLAADMRESLVYVCCVI